MAAHESQSLIVEMQACRSDAFLALPRARCCTQAFGGDAAPYQPANLARLWRRIERGFIRVDADEMTYPAHVILRFRLEQALVADTLTVADLPGAWNDGFQSLLGITPPDDARGCLQDIHWYDGAFGYFPSYTLGAMAAAQLMAAAQARRRGPRCGARHAATCRRCCTGCARNYTARAAGSSSTSCCPRHRQAARSRRLRGASDGAISRLNGQQ